MLHPSFNLAPVAPVELALSLPAKSTKLILDNFSDLVFPTVCICLNSIVTIVWALEDVLFIKVDPIVLFWYPSSILFEISS